MSTAPASHRPASTDTVWHPSDYLRILYKRRWVAIPSFLLLFLSGALSSIQTIPIYEATTQLLIEQDSRRPTSLDSLLDDRDGFDDAFYQTQYELMQSRSLALRTARVLKASGPPPRIPQRSGPDLSPGGIIELARTAGKNVLEMIGAKAKKDATTLAADARVQRGETPAEAEDINAYLGGLSVQPVRNTRLVNLNYRSPDAEFAARAVNELAKQYQQQSLEDRFMASREANDWLSAQLEEQRAKVLESEAAMQNYRETNNAASVNDRQNIVVQKLTELNAQVTKAKIDRLDKEAYYNRVMEIQRNGGSLDAVPAIVTNDLVQGLRARIDTLKAEQTKLANQGFGDSWPAMRDVNTQLATAETRLQVEMNQVVESIRNNYLAARGLETSLVQALETQKGESTQLDRKAIEYAALEREAVGNRELYEELMTRTKETGVSTQYRERTVQIVDSAEVPGGPVLPNVRQDLMLAGFKGFILAFLVVLGFEYFDSRLRTPDELKAHLGLPFLGMVPLAGGKNLTGESLMLSPDAPPSFCEAIRSIRTAVLFSAASVDARTLVVTSTGPSEGKTVISSNLAIALAQAGLRTLIIDADMRRPRMHEALGRAQEPGLSNVLVAESQLSDTVRLTGVPNLSFMPAGHIPPNPAELIGSPKYLKVMEELKTRFDWIVIDAPPVMPVTDAAILANTAGSVLFVVGAEMTSRQTASAALEQLRAANAKFTGTVLNRVNVARHGYYYSPYYRKEYGKYYQRSAHGA